ncbi:putative 1-deoxyxylulose-5-phosphate synthase [Haemophilus haemolyticus M19107]|nr:putative 1-deoxyxylulose-5-phosphate synthase [Haemophilus haemolyticus M19107]
MTNNMNNYPLLSLISSPEDLRLLNKDQLPQLCQELRGYLLESVSQTSGHLASGLGTVELTVALHYVYKTPFDQLIWDVGHQAYPHKILTGRRDQMSTIRQKNGIHPFPWREESEFDVLSVGHSSTSISAGLGIAVAAERENAGRKTVCVIGDGAITAGMAFEALNHAGSVHTDMLVILNDNEMSISENVGALNNHLARIFSGSIYSTLRDGSKKILDKVPPVKNFMKKTEEHMKGVMFSPESTLFEELGFNYIGPVDGHNIDELMATLTNMRNLKGPQFLHIKTKKVKDTHLQRKILLVSTAYQNLTQSVVNCLNTIPSQLIQKFLVIGYAKWQKKIPKLLVSHLQCVKALAWWSFLSVSQNNILM